MCARVRTSRERSAAARAGDSDEIAKLHQLEAEAALSQVTYGRAQREIAVNLIAQADFDQAAADLKVKQAAVAQQQAIVAKKLLRAPFAGQPAS